MKTLSIGQDCLINDSILSSCSVGSIELVVFGKGVGECVVIKTKTNKVVIVDSFINDDTGNPIAIDYLDKIGLGVESIKCLILTHFHDDHIKGAFEIIKKTNFAATLVVNPFIRHSHFLRAVAEKRISSNGELLSGVSEISSLMTNGIKLESAAINKILFVDEDDKDFSIVSLSPHDSELFLYLDSLALDNNQTVLDKYNGDKENVYSVVLLVKTNDICFLLGGDYPNKQGDINEGWSIVTTEYAKAYDCRSNIFKVPHHGSQTSQNNEVWEKMLTHNPVAVGTVYNRGHKVPSYEEIDWIVKKSKLFYLNGGYKNDSDTENLFRKTLGTTKVFLKSGKIGFTRFIVNQDSTIKSEFVGQVVEFSEQ